VIFWDGILTCMFCGNGMFRVSPLFDIKQMEEIFRHKVFKLHLKNEKITGELVEMVSGWRHSGFNVFCGSRNRGPALEGWGLSEVKNSAGK
jgi:hypothetical protein